MHITCVTIISAELSMSKQAPGPTMNSNIRRKGIIIKYVCGDTSVSEIMNGIVSNTSADDIINDLV